MNPYLTLMQDSLRYYKVVEALEELDLPVYLPEYLSEVNPSSNLPYHGHQHALTVALRAFEGAKYHNIDAHEIKLIFIAALFHDFNHLGASGVCDSKNISRSIEGFKEHKNFFTDLSPEDEQRIESLILSTMFPHGSSETTTLSEMILQDSDMMQTLEIDGQRFLDGLNKEHGTARTFQENQTFLEGFTFKTQWGLQKFV